MLPLWSWPLSTQPQARGKTVACIGDSLTWGGYSGGEPWPLKLGRLLGAGWAVTNFGIPGQQTPGMLAYWEGLAPAHYSVLTLLGGINDIFTDSRDAADIFANLQTIYEDAAAVKTAVVAITVMPVGNAAGSPAQITLETVNDSIRSYASASGLALFDAYAVFGQPGTPTQLATAYDIGDGVHINDAGDAVFAAALAPLIRP